MEYKSTNVHMNAGALKVYEIFKENLKLGEEKASLVIKYLENSTEEKIKAEIKHKITHLATKEDISVLKDDIVANREEILKSESSLREEILKSESSLREEILKSESSLREEILKSESSLREEILKLESSSKEDISILKDNITAVREDMLKSESSLKEDIQKLHASTIKWMFIFWVGAVATIISVMKFL